MFLSVWEHPLKFVYFYMGVGSVQTPYPHLFDVGRQDLLHLAQLCFAAGRENGEDHIIGLHIGLKVIGPGAREPTTDGLHIFRCMEFVDNRCAKLIIHIFLS